MAKWLYLTADKVGLETGGGHVTNQEVKAFIEEKGNDFRLIERDDFDHKSGAEPWKWDNQAVEMIKDDQYDLCHIYSGTFSKTAAKLKSQGTRIIWTIAAHDRFISRKEHELLGLQFPYPHLTQEPLWQRYIAGYLLADCVICPSTPAAKIVKEYPYTKRIEIIPHGCDIPKEVKPFPKLFTIGYLGAIGPDKGIRYLLEAWKKLDYNDAILTFGGRESVSPFMKDMVNKYGGGRIDMKGWIRNVSDFYNRISCYIQPSASEGFGLEILEAMAHGRYTIASDNSGGFDVLSEGYRFKPCDVDDLVDMIIYIRGLSSDHFARCASTQREESRRYEWSNIRNRYRAVWRSML